MIHIDDEAIADIAARETLLDRVMPDRARKPSQTLRAGRRPADGLTLVARDGGAIVGSVRLWNVAAGGRDALLLGPLCVDPRLQGRGVGSGLMQVALSRAASAGHMAVILVGEPDYYARFGFAADPASGLLMPAPVERRRFLGLELTEGGLAGAAGLVRPTGAEVASLRLAA